MPKALLRLLPLEMAILGLFEFAFLFALIFVILAADSPPLLLGSETMPRDCFAFAAMLAAMLATTIAGTAATIGLYRPEVCLDRGRFLLRGTTTALLAFPAILLVSNTYQVALSGEHVFWLAELLALWLSFVLLVRVALSVLRPRMMVARRVMIVGTGTRATRLRQRLTSTRHASFEPISAPDRSTGDVLTPEFVADRLLWGIVIAEDEPPAATQHALLDKKLRGVPVFSDLSFQDRHLGRIEPDAVDADWLLFADGFQNSLPSRAFKRVFDVAVAVALIFVTLPLMLLTAAMIKLDSRGPVLYRQERSGMHGATFTLFKFRSMAVDAEATGKPQWAQLRDPRVTRVGAFIRTCRIDELPQLFNVLRGEMSMIGPRPERPMFVEDLAKVIPFYNHRGYVKPGLTGWAQVNYPYGASIEDAREKLAYDLYYLKNRGVLLDVVILLLTIRVVLFREGAR